jgi:uncharacterized membrane protein
MNLFKFNHFDVLVDYAHNPAAMSALGRFLARTSAVRKTGIITAVGDRRDKDIRNMGSMAARFFDEIIIKHDQDLRGSVEDARCSGRVRDPLRELRHVARLNAPLHAIFAHFTIALTVSSLAFDAGGLVFGTESLATAGWWTLAAASGLTLLTLASGVSSRLRLPMEEGEARSFLRTHMALGPAFYGLLLAAMIWRSALWERSGPVSVAYLATLGAVVLVMTVQGYLGGELVYRYGAEVAGGYRRLPSARDPRSRRKPAEERRTDDRRGMVGRDPNSWDSTASAGSRWSPPS